jgi:hypothetical protein
MDKIDLIWNINVVIVVLTAVSFCSYLWFRRLKILLIVDTSAFLMGLTAIPILMDSEIYKQVIWSRTIYSFMWIELIAACILMAVSLYLIYKRVVPKADIRQKVAVSG